MKRLPKFNEINESSQPLNESWTRNIGFEDDRAEDSYSTALHITRLVSAVKSSTFARNLDKLAAKLGVTVTSAEISYSSFSGSVMFYCDGEPNVDEYTEFMVESDKYKVEVYADPESSGMLVAQGVYEK
jgi:hypothetical protein